MKNKFLLSMIFFLICICSTKTYATVGKTINETTRLRKSATTESEIIVLISQDKEVEIIEEEAEWYKVKYNNYTGFLRKDMLNVDESEENKINQEDEAKAENNSQNSSDNSNNDLIMNNNIEIEKGTNKKLASNISLKILPTFTSNVIGEIKEGTQITIGEVINKWCYIQSENCSGWMLTSKIKFVDDMNKNKTDEPINNLTDEKVENEDLKEDDKEENLDLDKKDNISNKKENNVEIIKYVATETLNLREKADNNSKIINQLSLNSQVIVEEVIDSTWSKIKFKGTTGYVASKYLSDKKQDISSRSESDNRELSVSKTSENNENEENKEDSLTKVDNKVDSQVEKETSSTGTDIVNYAKKYLGYKYVSGGTSPSTGFDCSGFTYYVYKHFGVTLSRTSTSQASNGVAVSKSDLKMGDLILFNNSSNSSIGHVGIYIGGNTFIHAANASKGVITTSLSDSYYSKRYVTARRVIN